MIDLDNIYTLKKIDKSNMLNLLFDFPLQCEKAYRIQEVGLSTADRNFKNIVFNGLGGSAMGGDIVKSYLSDKLKIPIIINRNYMLPEFVNEESLLFAVSYSGNTEETISAYNQAKKKKAKIVVITSGGHLLKSAEKDKIPYLRIPSGLPPRLALGYLFFPALSLLSKMGLVDIKDCRVEETVQLLKTLRNKDLGPDVKTDTNIAKQLASNLYGKFPIIYSVSNPFECISLRWRAELAENSKTLSSSNFFPELTHNEIVGWENPSRILKNLFVVILRDKEDYYKTKKRIDITKSIIMEETSQITEVWSRGCSLLSRIFSLIYIGDFVSFYLAILNKVDPTPVKRIDYLKEQLAKSSS